MAWKTPFFEVQNMGNGAVTMQSGLWGGYPGATGYRHNVRKSGIIEMAQNGSYPTNDGDPEHSALLAVEGEQQFDQRTLSMPEAMASGDLYLSPMRGGAGVGDPLERPAESVAEDLRGGYLSARLAESVYAVAVDGAGDVDAVATERLRAAAFDLRRMHSVPVTEWLATERERAARDELDLIDPVRRMYAESMRLSPSWAAEFREFWELPEDFRFEIATPTVDISEALLEHADPETLQRQPRTDVEAPLPQLGEAVSFAEPVTGETLSALIDGELPGPQVRQLQSGFKDQVRFATWISLCQERWPFAEDRVLLPLGLHMAIVERPDGERVVRSDSGHVFGHWRENWKLGAHIRVRDSVEAMHEIFPDKMAPSPKWNTLREYLDPISMTMLDVESVPPLYPIVHDFLPDLDAFYRDWLGEPLESRA